MIKENNGSLMVESTAIIFKLLIISVAFFQISLYLITVTRFNMALNETMERARIEGLISEKLLMDELDKYKIDYGNVTIVECVPNFDSRVKRLGDRLSIKAYLAYDIRFTELWDIKTRIHSAKHSINEGYYGDGYVEY